MFMAEDDVKFCDLTRFYSQNKEALHEIFDDVCSTAAYSDGEFVLRFEKNFAKFCNSNYASCVNSGTSALFLAMKVLDIGEGDEVIVPSCTFVATAWGVAYTGATPVFVDCKKDTWQIDENKIEDAITEKTKAIIGVHLYGLPFNVLAVKKIADKHKLFLIEDSAQAHGATYENHIVGSLSDMACYSFYPTKNLGSFGEGGCVTTNCKEYKEKIDFLKKHAVNENGNHVQIGYNMRMSGIQAAILDYKLKSIDASNQKRIEIAHRYKNEIKNSSIVFQHIPQGYKSVFHLFVVCVDDRKSFINYLGENKIGHSIHYRVPCHLNKAFKHLGYKIGDLPCSEYLFEHCVSLPMYPEMTSREVDRVIEVCNGYKGE